MMDHKATLHRYLQTSRESLLWKLEDLSDYDMRRPLTPTGTNLLGVVKHVASVEIGYFTEVFGRPCPVDLPWFDDGAPVNADMYATESESHDFIVDLYRQSWSVSDDTINELALDAAGFVPWWGEGQQDVSLQQILVHMTVETSRHAGHADIVRELIDGAKGYRSASLNLPEFDSKEWSAYYDTVNAVSLGFATPLEKT